MKPSTVLILADQLRADLLSCCAPYVHTPHLDTLAQNPHKQRNLFHDPQHLSVRDRLDPLLAQAIMEGIKKAALDRRVCVTSFSARPPFERKG